MRFGSLEPPQFILLGPYFSGIDDFAMFRSEKYMSTTPRFRLFIYFYDINLWSIATVWVLHTYDMKLIPP